MVKKYIAAAIILCSETLINIGTQSNKELPEVYCRILNHGMVVEGEGREYTMGRYGRYRRALLLVYDG